MYLHDEIRAEMSELADDDLVMSESMDEEQLFDRSLEYGVMDRPLPHHHRRLWTLYERKTRELQAGADLLRQDAPGLDEAELNGRICDLAALERVAGIISSTFWEDVQREFPELRRRDSLMLIEGWRVAWHVPHPCAERGCPARKECDERYGKKTPPEERHRMMEEDGWDAEAVIRRNALAMMLGLEPEDLGDMEFGTSQPDDTDGSGPESEEGLDGETDLDDFSASDDDEDGEEE